MATHRTKAEMWADWTRDAMEVYDPPAKVKSLKAVSEDMAAFTAAYADKMLKALEARFEGPGAPEEPEEEPEEEDEDDEDDEDDEP